MAEKDRFFIKKSPVLKGESDDSGELFIQTVRSVAEIVKISERPLSEEEIAGYFKDMNLSKEQLRMIYVYLQEIRNEKPDTESDTNTNVLDKTTGFNKTENLKKTQRLKKIENRKETNKQMPASVCFKMYQKDLERIEPCTGAEEEKLYESLIFGDEKAMQKLSDQWLPKIFRLAEKSCADAKEMADVIQEGNLAVFLTLQHMLGSKQKVDFHHVLSKAAKDAMNRYLEDTAAVLDMDHSLIAKAALVYEAQKFLTEKLVRVPTTAELSQYTRMSEEELEDIFALKFR